MKNRLKNQNGVISVFAMFAMVFFMVFMLGAFMVISRNNRIQKEANKELIDLYSTETNGQALYNLTIATKDEAVPIYTYAQVNKIGTNNYECINGKIYKFDRILQGYSNGVPYELKGNLGLDERIVYKRTPTAPYSNELDDFNAIEFLYSDYTDLTLSLDGTNNSGIDWEQGSADNKVGHSNKVATWKNLAYTRDSSDVKAYSVYSGNHEGSILTSLNWTQNGLDFDGSGDYIKANVLENNGVSEPIDTNHTYEMVFELKNSASSQNIMGNWSKNQTGTGLLLFNKDGKLRLAGNLQEMINNKLVTNMYVTDDADNVIENGRKYHVALTFDGDNMNIYKNGKKIATQKYSEAYKNSEELTFSTLKSLAGIGVNVRIDSAKPNGLAIRPYNTSTGDQSYLDHTRSYMNFIIDGTTKNQQYFGATFEYYENFSALKKHQINMLFWKTGAYGTPAIYNNYQIGYPNDASISGKMEVVVIGTNSVIIKTDTQVESWTFNGAEYFPTPIETGVDYSTVLGNYYYYFSDLAEETAYTIKCKYKSKNLNTVLSPTVLVGKKYDNKVWNGTDEISGGFLNATVYTVRVYPKTLSSDQIRANYLIDKSRYSIRE